MIPVSRTSVTALEREYLTKVLDDNFLSGGGEFVRDFENYWSAYNKYEYGVACNSGTTAMYLALLALGIGPGDEVIVPEFTMAATAWAVSYTGATPVFVDCDENLNINPNNIVISPKTRAIMPVHIYGRKVQDRVYEMAREHGLFIVEDMAEAHGIMPKGHIACYSFQGNKIITSGEGGMCITNDKSLADEMRKLSSLYFDQERTMIHQKIGYNFRMTNMQAAIGLAQAMRIRELLEKRDTVADNYDKYLPESMRMPKRDVVWMYDIRVTDNTVAKGVLYDNGIDSRYGFKPMSMQPMYYSDMVLTTRAYQMSKQIMYLPTFPDLDVEAIKYICETLSTLV